MNETTTIILTLTSGLLLGTFFFGGLWWTTKWALRSKSPAIWFMASLFIRLGITITGFYLISRGLWERVLICLLGFIIARIIMIRITQVRDKPKPIEKEG